MGKDDWEDHKTEDTTVIHPLSGVFVYQHENYENFDNVVNNAPLYDETSASYEKDEHHVPIPGRHYPPGARPYMFNDQIQDDLTNCATNTNKKCLRREPLPLLLYTTKRSPITKVEDQVKSMRIAAGCVVTVFEHKDFEGEVGSFPVEGVVGEETKIPKLSAYYTKGISSMLVQCDREAFCLKKPGDCICSDSCGSDRGVALVDFGSDPGEGSSSGDGEEEQWIDGVTNTQAIIILAVIAAVLMFFS
jgi:hypothetical protein